MDYHHYLVLLVVSRINKMLAQQSGICSNGTGEVACCDNYFKDGNVCTVCPPGTFGPNCSNPCPNGYYGKLCGEVCDDCLSCDKVHGCVKNQDCPPGTSGPNCSTPCPNGYHGKLCGEVCNGCLPCDKVHGCVKNKVESKPRPMNLDWRTVVLSVAGSFTICFIVGIVVCCRVRHGNLSSRSYCLENEEASYRNKVSPAFQEVSTHRPDNPEELRNWNQKNNPLSNCRTNVADCAISTSNQQTKPQPHASGTSHSHDELEPYDILSLKCPPASDFRKDSVPMPVYNTLTRQVNHFKATEPKCRESFLYPKHASGEDAKYYKLEKQKDGKVQGLAFGS